VDEEVRPTRYGKIMRATRSPIDPDELRAGLDELARRVTTGRPEPVSETLWSILRGRGAAGDGESEQAPPSFAHEERS
jgi:hypothetical protein